MTSLIYHLNLIFSPPSISPKSNKPWRLEYDRCRLCCHILLLPMLGPTNRRVHLARISIQADPKNKQYVKKKLGNPKKEGNLMKRERNGYYIDVGHSGSFRIEGFCWEECRGDCGNCMEEVEKVLEDMSRKGEFSFGSFWGGEDLEESFPMYLVKQLKKASQCIL